MPQYRAEPAVLFFHSPLEQRPATIVTPPPLLQLFLTPTPAGNFSFFLFFLFYQGIAIHRANRLFVRS